jgi:heavy metal translocating P-type ATPase
MKIEVDQEQTEKMDFCSKSSNTCALCSQSLGLANITENNYFFCCHGCRAVFNILVSKNQLNGFEKNPIFLQALRSGLISNPVLLEHIQRQRSEIELLAREKIYFEIADMWCPSCAELIRLIMLKERGILNCVVDYATDLASVEFTPQLISKEKIKEVIFELGYMPTPLEGTEKKVVSKDLHWRFAVAAFCSLNIMMLAYPLYATYFDYDGEGYGNLFAWLSFLTSLPILFYSAWPIWRRFAVSLKTGFFGMETLVAIGVGAATVVSLIELFTGGTRVYFDSMSVVIVFVLLGKIIEARAKFSAKDSLLRLTRSTPRRGRKRFNDGTLKFVPLKEIAKGDCLVAYSGEKLVLDGIVSEGEGTADESLMTGEVIPITKKRADMILGGAILVQGWIAYTVSASLEESTLSKIIEMVENDIGHKSVYVRAADKVVRWFVPLVILMALLTAVFYLFFPDKNDVNPDQTALLRALSLLLISCPCAIGIAAPAAESYLLNRLAGLGAIVRNRGVLPFLGKETVIVFDKTGTVTEGRFTVFTDLKKQMLKEEREILSSLASHSTHPISCAIFGLLADEQRVPLEKLEEIPGIGLRAAVSGVNYFLGSPRFLSSKIETSFSSNDTKEESGIISKVCFLKENDLIIEITLGDRIRLGVPEMIAAMRLESVRTVLLSGDSEVPVAAVAHRSGFDEWHSGCTPLEKREYIEEQKAKGEIVCMVGDGINDAPALTMAHVGVSIVSATDISIQVSDLLLTTDRIGILTPIRALSCKGQTIVRQNLFWAFFYNVIGIGMAMMGVLTPVFAAIAMSLSSLCVLFNAKRIDRHK